MRLLDVGEELVHGVNSGMKERENMQRERELASKPKISAPHLRKKRENCNDAVEASEEAAFYTSYS